MFFPSPFTTKPNSINTVAEITTTLLAHYVLCKWRNILEDQIHPNHFSSQFQTFTHCCCWCFQPDAKQPRLIKKLYGFDRTSSLFLNLSRILTHMGFSHKRQSARHYDNNHSTFILQKNSSLTSSNLKFSLAFTLLF